MRHVPCQNGGNDRFAPQPDRFLTKKSLRNGICRQFEIERGLVIAQPTGCNRCESTGANDSSAASLLCAAIPGHTIRPLGALNRMPLELLTARARYSKNHSRTSPHCKSYCWRSSSVTNRLAACSLHLLSCDYPMVRPGGSPPIEMVHG
jgi:hypothetical protein